MKKMKYATERLLQAMEHYDKFNETWQKCIEKFQLCNTYKYMPAAIRTRESVNCMKYISNVRYNNPKIFRFILEEVCGVKPEQTDTIFSLDNIADKELVAELRKRGFDVTATKVIKQTISL